MADLHDAFIKAVQKYYDGFDYAATNGSGNKKFEYDFKTLDAMHKTIVPKSTKNSVVTDVGAITPEVSSE